MTAVRRSLSIFALALAGTAAIAQAPSTTNTTSTTSTTSTGTTVQRTTEPVTAVTDQDVTNPRSLRLSLDDAVRTSMERNLGITLQRYDYLMSSQSLLAQYGIYDFFANGTFQESINTRASANRLQSGSSRAYSADLGITQMLPTGGTYDFRFVTDRTSSSAFGTTINPSYGSNLSASVTQPLLRNFGVDITNRNITIARNTLGINRELFRNVLMNTAVSVEQAYLDLEYARRNVDVVKEALFLARDQARITQIRIDVGASAPLDILQPRVQIATEEENLIAAVASVRDAEDRLRALMNLPPADWDRPIVPTDTVGYTPLDIDTTAAVARAVQLRPELRQDQLATASARLQYIYAKNQTLPRLDAFAGYGAAGLAGTALATDPFSGQPTGLSSTSYPHSISQVLRGTFPSWNVGVTVGVPLLNIGARAEAKRAQLAWQQSASIENQTRQNIEVDVRKAVRDVNTAAQEISATRTAREAAEANLNAERKRYENGMTTNFNVLQIQQQLSDARVREIQALVGYNKAVANYHRAVGDLLDVRNIRTEDEVPDEPRIFGNYFDRYSWMNYDTRGGAATTAAPPAEEPKR